jgi:hypothetical protein
VTEVAERCADLGHLTLDALHELRTIATGYAQSLEPRREEAAGALDPHAPSDVLRIDDRDAARPHGQVIDVRKTHRDAAVVQEEDALAVQQLFEAGRDAPLAVRARPPCLNVRWIARHAHRHYAKAAILLPRAFLALFAQVLVATTSPGAGRAVIERLAPRDRLWWRLRYAKRGVGLACHAPRARHAA